MTATKRFFFAGGGTAGHIYPGIAVAEQLIKLEHDVKIHFFSSTRGIDSQILSRTGFRYTQLPAKGFSARPDRLIGFCGSFLKSYRIAKELIAENGQVVVTGLGGFVSAPVCLAAQKLRVPVVLLNVDVAPGRANKLTAHWARYIFVQFDQTCQYFTHSGATVSVVGCPLRSSFANPQPAKLMEQLGLDSDKKILLVTGASSGSHSINASVCSLLPTLDNFAGDWQIVHITGSADFDKVKQEYTDAKIAHKALSYCHDMADLLTAAELVIGRSGAVSVAEYTAASVPSICMPYPHHKDRHQYLNADKLVQAGAAVIVDDLSSANERTEWLAEELQQLMRDARRRGEMKQACLGIAKRNAESKIAEKLLEIAAHR